MSSFWIACLSQFEQELPPQQFNTWIRPLRLEGEDDFANGMRLLAPNGFILKWVKERYLTRIEELGSAFFSTPVRVSLILGERTTVNHEPSPSSSTQQVAPTENPDKLKSSPLAPQIRSLEKKSSHYETTRLISGFTFDNLIVGKANDLARAASAQVSINPGALPITRCSFMGSRPWEDPPYSRNRQSYSRTESCKSCSLCTC